MNKLSILILGIIMLNMVYANVQSDKTYTFEINKEDGYISHGDITLFNSIFSERSNENEGPYRAILAEGDEPLYTLRFELSTSYYIEPSEECFTQINSTDCIPGEYLYDNSTGSVILNFPYFPTANNIKVYDGNILLFNYTFENKTENLFIKYKYHLLAGGALLGIIIIWIILRKRKALTLKQSPFLQNRYYPQNYPRYAER